MLNDQARELIDPADQVDADRRGHRGAERRAAAHPGRPAQRGRGPGARAAELDRPGRRRRRAARAAGRAATSPARPRTGAAPPTAALPAAVGSGLLWTKCCQAVDRHFQHREWLILEGEPGTGKTTLARATHQARTPAGALPAARRRRLRPAAGSPRSSRSWRPAAAARWCSPTSTGCRPDGRQALVDALEPHRESTDPERPWVVATIRAGGLPATEIGAELLELLPAHGRGAAAAAPRGGRGRAGAAPDRPADPRRRS